MIKLLQGDCLKELKELKDNSIDSIVTDPPYGLGFMGKQWDTFDKTQFGNAGSEGANDLKVKKNFKTLPRYRSDNSFYEFSFAWAKEVFRVLKPGGYLLSFGGSRTYHRMACAIEDAGFEIRDMIEWVYGSGFPKSHNIGKAVDKKLGNERETKWNGWGTALKPAHEPIVMARKPLSEKTVASNVLKYGTGGINIDESRVGFENKEDYNESTKKNQHGDFGTKPMTNNNVYGDYSMIQPKNYAPASRFPANLIHDGSKEILEVFGDKSRFFYCAKTSKTDRNEGLEKNNHPTVKPTKLMRYLVRLVTPKGGIVLDPFMGSGSTGKACMMEGFSFIGIEKESEYMKIAEARIKDSIPKQTRLIK